LPVSLEPSPSPTEPPVARKKGRPPQATVPDDRHDWGRIEPEILDGTLTTTDLAFALDHLHFTRNNLCTVQLDRDVRDFLLTALRRPMPLALSDDQLRIVMAAAARLPVEQRSAFLERLAAEAERPRLGLKKQTAPGRKAEDRSSFR
jgi:hypothetical protein